MYKSCKTKQSAQRQRHVVDCLLEMLQSQDFSQVTVQALCRRAQLPRKTFYRYFECKEDVFDAAVDFLMMDFAAFDGPYRPEGGEAHTAEKDMEKLFLFWQAHRDVLHSLVNSGRWEALMARLDAAAAAWRQPAQREGAGADIAQTFVTHGLYAVVLQWIGQGCPGDAGALARQMVHLLSRPLLERPEEAK